MADRLAGDTAVVIGAGMAGLLAARVLSDHFPSVVVLDRDRLPDGPTWRRKTPQSIHSHVLGSLGYRLITGLLPTLDDDLAAEDAPVFDYLGDCVSVSDRWGPRFRSGLVSRMCSRMLLEWAIRRRVVARDNVVIRDGFRASGFAVDGARVCGVVDPAGRAVPAALVVDASGIGSRTPAWLESAGLGRPPELMVDLRGATSSRLFRLPRERWPDWIALFVRMTSTNPRQAAIARIEQGLWRVSMSGVGGCYTPKGEDDFLAYAAALPDPTLHDMIATAEPVSPVYYYGNSRSRWLLYHQMPRLPDGLVVIGDAVFHPNSEHAQGMTFCVLAALALGEALGRVSGSITREHGFSARFQRQLARAHEPYWTWNNAVELAIPGTRGPEQSRRERLLHHYYGMVRQAAAADPVLLGAAIRVTQAERHPFSMFHPSHALRAMRAGSRAAMGRDGERVSGPPPAAAMRESPARHRRGFGVSR